MVVPRNKQIWRPDTIFGGQEEDRSPAGVGGGQRSRVVVEPSGYVRLREVYAYSIFCQRNIFNTESAEFRATFYKI